MRPETTGDTLKGKSMSVMSRLLPGKRYFEISHAAATPNTTLSGTAIAAVNKVSLMAAIESASLSFARYGPTPLANASMNTEAMGSTTNRPRNANARPISSARIGHASVTVTTLSGRWPGAGARPMLTSTAGASNSAMAAPARPALQQVDGHKQQERSDQHHHGQRGRARVVVLLELGDNEQRHDLRVQRLVARDEHDRPVLAHRAGEGQGEPGEQGRDQRGKDDLAEGLEPGRAQDRRRLLGLDVE